MKSEQSWEHERPTEGQKEALGFIKDPVALRTLKDPSFFFSLHPRMNEFYPPLIPEVFWRWGKSRQALLLDARVQIAQSLKMEKPAGGSGRDKQSLRAEPENYQCCDKEIMELCWKWKYLKSLIPRDFEFSVRPKPAGSDCAVWLTVRHVWSRCWRRREAALLILENNRKKSHCS